jgi:hypothetical protein
MELEMAAVQNIKEDIGFDKVAVRLLLKTVYRKVLGDYDKDDHLDLVKKHKEGFLKYIEKGAAEVEDSIEPRGEVEETETTEEATSDVPEGFSSVVTDPASAYHPLASFLSSVINSGEEYSIGLFN